MAQCRVTWRGYVKTDPIRAVYFLTRWCTVITPWSYVIRRNTQHCGQCALQRNLYWSCLQTNTWTLCHFSLHNHFYLSWTARATARGRDTTSSLDRRCDCTDGLGGTGVVQSSIIQHWSGRSKAKRSIHSVQIENSLARYCGQVLCSKRSTINEHSEESFVKQWR